jgi:asparagine synthase (glutamine-hydrolysing)
MCGFFGVYTFATDAAPDGNALRASIQALRHRGPDAAGQHMGPGIALGHTRLSFLDLSPEGNQPIWDETRRYAIVYNGEIYNFRELRARLEQRGCRFRTTSDTEVLLYGLINEGPQFLRDANGMFAFALYDSQEHTLLLGRDRFGIKPLFWVQTGQGVVFSSEIKALRPWVPFVPEERMLAAFLAGFDLPTANTSLLQNVRFFPTGCSALIDRQRSTIRPQPFFELKQFWNPQTADELARMSTEALVDRFDELLNESVRLHMIADVPIGALCSGGVDSSIILALTRKHSANLAIYHANVLGPQSEYSAAKALAEHLKLDLLTVEVRDADFIDHFAEVLGHVEFPFLYHPNSIPFLQVTKLVKQHGTKAVLTGEGSDEILLGYSHIPLQRRILQYHAAVDAVRSAFHRVPWLGRILWRSPGDAKATLGRQLITGFEGVSMPQFASSPQDADKEYRAVGYHLLSYHLRTLLMRNDRLGMASSIEARFPFLEHETVEFAVNLPRSLKIRASLSAIDEIRHPLISTKWILRQVAARYLPRSLAFRAKRGFPTSAFDRIRVDPQMLRGSWVSDHYGFDEDALAHLTATANNGDLLRLVMLDAWARINVLGERTAEVSESLRRSLQFARA